MPEFKGLTISVAITEFGEGVPSTHVTEGNYLLELDSLVGSMTNDGDAFISFRTKIVDGPIGMEPQGAGLPVWTMCAFSEKREWATGQMLNAVGIPPAALVGRSFPATPAGFDLFKTTCQTLGQQTKGRKFGATLTDYTGGKVPTSQIQRPFPTAEFEAQKTAAEAARPAQPPSPTNGSAPAAGVSDADLQNQLSALLTQSTPTV